MDLPETYSSLRSPFGEIQRSLQTQSAIVVPVQRCLISALTCMDVRRVSTLFACCWRFAIFSRAAPEAADPFFVTLSPSDDDDDSTEKERRQEAAKWETREKNVSKRGRTVRQGDRRDLLLPGRMVGYSAACQTHIGLPVHFCHRKNVIIMFSFPERRSHLTAGPSQQRRCET